MFPFPEGTPTTTILGGTGTDDQINARVEAVRTRVATAGGQFIREKLFDRIAQLTGNLAVVHVGGRTPEARSEELLRLSNALGAVRTAYPGRIAPGAGAALLAMRRAVLTLNHGQPEDEIAIELVAAALEEPVRALITNSKHDPDPVLKSIDAAGGDNIGFNVHTKRVEDAVASGIIDPYTVVRRKLDVAVTEASAFLETGAWEA